LEWSSVERSQVQVLSCLFSHLGRRQVVSFAD
jgi:hypothetical protein